MANKTQFLKPLLISIVLTALTPVAFASGSYSPQGGAGITNPYQHGKTVFFKKISCKKCSMPKARFNAEKARSFINDLKTDKQLISLLDEKEREAVAYYLQKRFLR